MEISYNGEKLRQIIDDLCALTGLAMDIFDTEFNCIYGNTKENAEYCNHVQQSAVGYKMCIDCDSLLHRRAKEMGGPFSHICHAGLCDTCVPFFKNGTVAGYIVIGRAKSNPTLSEETLAKLESQGLDREDLIRIYAATPLFEKRRLDSLIRIIAHCLFENAVDFQDGSFIRRASEYIDAHLSADLSLSALCRELHVSKNYLYKSFRNFYGKTVNDYVNSRRIKRAAEMLSLSDMSAGEVAVAVGIDNYTYFSKVFKKNIGVSPAKYRKIK